MAKEWTPDADWIAYSNAVAQENYYLKSIVKSERSLHIMDIMKVPFTDPGRKQTVKEIKYKNQLLQIAQFKVKRSFLRVTEIDKVSFEDDFKELFDVF